MQTTSLTRLNNQISANGSEPLEIIRADSWFYSIFNIRAHFLQGALSKSTNVSYFQYNTPSGTNILTALDYVVGFAMVNGTGWPYSNSGDFSPTYVIALCRSAYVEYKDVKYINYANGLIRMYGAKVSGLPSLWAPYNAFKLSSGVGVSVSALFVVLIVMCVVG